MQIKLFSTIDLLFHIFYFQSQMGKLLNYNLLLALAILSSASPLTKTKLMPYRAGFSDIFFETHSPDDRIQNEQTQMFTLQFDNFFVSQPSAVISIAGTQGLESTQKMQIISIKIQGISKQSLIIKASIIGRVNSVQIAYLIYDKNLQKSYSIWFWNQNSNQRAISTQPVKNSLKISLSQIGQTHNKQTIFNQKIFITEIDMNQNKILKVVPMMSSLVISDDALGQLVEVSLKDQINTIQVKVVEFQYLKQRKIKILFTLLVQFSLPKAHFRVNQPEIILETKWYTINDLKTELSSPEQKILLLGLNSLNQKSLIDGVSVEFDYESSWFTVQSKFSQEKQLFLYSSLKIKQKKPQVVRLLSLTCSNGFYQPGSSWLYNSISSWPSNDCRGPCNSNTCQPCPLGCLTCVSVDCTWKVSCTSCNTTGNFSAVNTGCDKTQYTCSCPNNTFPSYKYYNCSTCASIIPNCQSCATNQYVGTYCSSCDPGYFKVLVWYKDGVYYSNLNVTSQGCDNCGDWSSGYARSCASCPTGCSVCYSKYSCSTCFNGMYRTQSGTCTCNSTNSLFYNPATQTCTSCSASIPGCLNCTLSGTTTSCNTCSTGYYRDPVTFLCVKCPTYCTSCNSTTCLSCSSTFIPQGSSCVCASQYFVKTSPSPATCQSCTFFQPNCQTCFSNTTGVYCNLCVSNYYLTSSLTCAQCIPRCTSCVDSLTCQVCTDLTLMNPNNNCQCNSGYVLTTSSTCVLCSSIIPYCDSCDSITKTCSHCVNPYYNSSTTLCTACPLGCTSCTNGTYCTACILGFNLVPSETASGLADLQSCQCNNAQCTTTCPALTANCTTCTVTTCQSCAYGYFLSPTFNCTACPSNCTSCNATSCITCNDTFTVINGVCTCNDALQLYYNSVSKTCTSCSSINSLCLICENVLTLPLPQPSKCLNCTTGYYPVPNTVTCLVCPSTCTACTDAATCTSCKPTYLILAGTTMCACDTGAQYFSNPPNGCQHCSDILTGCITCSIDTNKPPPSVICTDAAIGYYIDSTTLLSQPCPSTCVSCTSSTTCTSCQITYSLDNGKCTCNNTAQLFQAGGYCAPCYTFIPYCTTCNLNVATVQCTTCGSGTYPNGATTCSLCGANCVSCTSSTVCQTCISGFLPSPSTGGICTFTNQCASFTTPDPNCAFCALSGTSTTICTSCKAGFYVDNQVSCMPCPSTCTTCSAYLTCLICEPTFTLKNGACVCDQSLDQVLLGSVCVSCLSQVPKCATCSSNVAPVTCTKCVDTYTIVSGACSPCGSNCLTCDSTLVYCTSCLPSFTLSATNTCINGITCAAGYYNASAVGSCSPCGTNCTSCLSSTNCLTCIISSMLPSGGNCSCDTTNGFFYNSVTNECVYCGATPTTYTSNYPINCSGCIVTSTANYAEGYMCSVCNNGNYLLNGACVSCDPGCSQCTGTGLGTCSICVSPQYALTLTATCKCNANANYFLNTTTNKCDPCTLTSCTVCSSLTSCTMCIAGYFSNSSTHLCQPEICGNGRLEGVQQCDDGNNLNGDGCDFDCDIEPYFACINLVEGALSSCLAQQNKFMLQVIAQEVQCNKITIKLENVGTEDVSQCNISSLLKYYQFKHASLASYSINGKIISYTFTYNHTIQGIAFNLVFNSSTLCVKNAAYFPPFNITGNVSPTNNRGAIYYPQGQCESHATLTKITTAMQYASYGTLFLSALPCKIVGLQLFGVLQLSYLSLGSLDNINLMLQPLTQMGGVNGYRLDLGGDKTSRLLQAFTPERINAIDYKANFLRNCNVMLLLILAVICVSFLLYIMTYIFKKCAPSFHKVAKRLIKEVLLTLILFNALNFAYTAGVHLRYAPTNDPLYLLGTLAAAGTLIIPVLMAIALLCTEEDGFGQFKDKLKAGCLEKAYFVITIVYRMGVGLYMSSANQDDLSTLILLAFSILFVVYNLVNLPFRKAYHNYRANICHLTQFVVLYVAMYYRSMRSTTPLQESSSIFSPVYFQYVCIFVSLLVSVIVLIYEMYLFVKECCCSKQVDVRNSHQVINKTEQDNSQVNIQSAPDFQQEQKKQSAEYAFEQYQ